MNKYQIELLELENEEQLREAIKAEIESELGELPKCHGQEMQIEFDNYTAYLTCEKCNNFIKFEYTAKEYPAEPDVGIMNSYIEIEIERSSNDIPRKS